MSTTTHTPGPWRYEPTTRTIRSIPGNHWIVTVDSWDGAVDNEANARLIAKAPQMHYLLARFVGWAEQIREHDSTPVGRLLAHGADVDDARALLAAIDGEAGAE